MKQRSNLTRINVQLQSTYNTPPPQGQKGYAKCVSNLTLTFKDQLHVYRTIIGAKQIHD